MPFLVATNSTLDRSQRRSASTGCASFQLLGQFAELLHLAPIDRLEQGLAGREMPVERADADPGARATASRLASGPPALKTAFAASSTRSRLRTASARGFRGLFSDCPCQIVQFDEA